MDQAGAPPRFHSPACPECQPSRPTISRVVRHRRAGLGRGSLRRGLFPPARHRGRGESPGPGALWLAGGGGDAAVAGVAVGGGQGSLTCPTSRLARLLVPGGPAGSSARGGLVFVGIRCLSGG